jgi:hypothetical protein
VAPQTSQKRQPLDTGIRHSGQFIRGSSRAPVTGARERALSWRGSWAAHWWLTLPSRHRPEGVAEDVPLPTTATSREPARPPQAPPRCVAAGQKGSPYRLCGESPPHPDHGSAGRARGGTIGARGSAGASGPWSHHEPVGSGP